MPLIRTLKFAFHLKFWAITKKEKKFRCLDFRTLDSGKKCLFFTLYFYIFDLENWMLWISHCKHTRFGIFLRIQKQIFLTRKLICRFMRKIFIQIPGEGNQVAMEFFCASDLKYLSGVLFGVNSYRSFRFHRFRKFWHLVEGVFHFACFFLFLFCSAERYQVHQKFSLVIGKSDEFFGLGMNLNRNIFTHFPI